MLLLFILFGFIGLHQRDLRVAFCTNTPSLLQFTGQDGLLRPESEGGAPIHSPAVGVSRERVLPKNYFNYLVLRNCQLGFGKTSVSPMMGCWRFSDPRILGAVAASQQTYFIVSGSQSNTMLGGGDKNTMLLM